LSANRLRSETSPYLQQHADNPVDWYPWGEEALRAAQTQDKPILLSIGYSACHWCHVMAHESFEDPAVAKVMSDLFINIKVDREERPDLDQIYQSAHSLLTQRPGGWPLTMFLTPDQKPFFGGTYFPKSARFGLPGFADLLERVSTAYRNQRAQINEQNTSLLEALQRTLPSPDNVSGELDDAAIGAAIDDLIATIDSENGGFGGAPKFPHPAELEFSFYFGEREPRLRDHALYTLEKMAAGGINDQLGGGFSRYSVDQHWMIPHFEKMLYDNGPLLALYADAWRLQDRPLFQRVAEDTAGWVMREMQSDDGGYYSSIDADSEGAEGRFYVWSREQIGEVLDRQESAVVNAHYGLDGKPNFEHQAWHLHVSEPLEAVAAKNGMSVTQANQLLQRSRGKLLAAREQRVHPGRDEKILVSWNALMIRGMARAARIFGREDWLQSARRAVDFIAGRMFDGERLLATYKSGRAHLNAYLDDYAFLVLALQEMMQAEFRVSDLDFACALSEALLEQFESVEEGGFDFVSHDHEPLIFRPRPGHDNATPSGNAVASLALLRMGYLLGQPRYLDSASRALRVFLPQMVRHPGGFATMCMALNEALVPTRTVILRGDRDRLGEWRQALPEVPGPATLLLALDVDIAGLPPVLDKPGASGTVNAYLCEGVKCLRPVQDIAGLRALMERGKPSSNQYRQ
jgi:hypothetical protein